MSEPDDRLQDDIDDSDVAHRLKSGMLWLRDGRIVVRTEQGLVFLGFWDSEDVQALEIVRGDKATIEAYGVRSLLSAEKYDPSQPRGEHTLAEDSR